MFSIRRRNDSPVTGLYMYAIVMSSGTGVVVKSPVISSTFWHDSRRRFRSMFARATWVSCSCSSIPTKRAAGRLIDKPALAAAEIHEYVLGANAMALETSTEQQPSRRYVRNLAG